MSEEAGNYFMDGEPHDDVEMLKSKIAILEINFTKLDLNLASLQKKFNKLKMKIDGDNND